MSSSKLVIVSGASRGLGRAFAEGLAEDGYQVAALYRQDRDGAESLAATHPTRIHTYPVDLAKPEEISEVVKTIQSERGPIYGVLNNAFQGGRVPAKSHEVPAAEFLADLQVNLQSAFCLSAAAVPSMLEHGEGRILFIGSLAMHGEPGRVSYAVAKQGLVGLAKTMAKEYARNQITANVVAPGFMEAGAFLRLSDEIKTRALKRVPSRRAGQSDEVLGLIRYLLAPEGAYTTGQVISVDGGAAR